MTVRVRERVFDVFWRFTAERQRIFERRAAGAIGPWTSDRILAEYKFCNVYRAADRVSQYLIKDVCYTADRPSSADLAFQIVAMRTFSNISTWQALREKLGGAPTLADLADDRFERALTEIKEENGGLYTGAFILCATDAYGRRTKHLNHVELFRDMFLVNDLAGDIQTAQSMSEIYSRLHEFPLMGDFMSYQIAVDINYSELTAFSEDDFTMPGPGALRGLKKVFEDFGGLSPAELVFWLVERQNDEFAKRSLNFRGLWGRPLHAIDVQNLLCETDKYCREAMPELTSARSRIKSRFKPSATPVDYFFPPKWGLPLPAEVRAEVA